MRVLVTGATGDLGARVVGRLLADGREVVVVSRRPFRAQTMFADRVRVLEWHPSCDPPPNGLADGVDAIVHLAGAPLDAGRDPHGWALAGQSRVTVAGRLTDAFRERPVRVVAASIALPSAASGDVMTEVTPRAAPQTDFEREVLAAEAACNGLAAAGGATIVRLGLLMRAEGVFGRMAALARRGLMVPLDQAVIPVIDPDDAAALLAGLVDRSDFPGTLLGIAPEPLSGDALRAALLQLTPARLVIPVGERLGRRQIGPLAALVFNRVRLVPQRLTEARAGFVYPDPARQLDDLVARWTTDRGTIGRDWSATLRQNVASLVAQARR